MEIKRRWIMTLKGLYLVVDATMPREKLLPTLQRALEGGVDLVQLWGEWKDRNEALSIGREILVRVRKKGVPLIIANDLELCQLLEADGIHFDGYGVPEITPRQVKEVLGQQVLVGLTVGNSVEKIQWAGENGADYISFCAMFPTPSVDSCEIVPVEMIREAKRLVSIPVFASGGITLENLQQVLEAGADGIAVVSAILNAENPLEAARGFKERLVEFEQRRIVPLHS